MWIRLIGQQNVASTAQITNFWNEEGTGNDHHGICSRWHSYWCSINDMIGFGGSSHAEVWMVWLGCMHGWCVCIVDAIGVDMLVGGFGRGVSEV